MAKEPLGFLPKPFIGSPEPQIIPVSVALLPLDGRSIAGHLPVITEYWYTLYSGVERSNEYQC
jgi:hypothetical protein